MHTRTSQTDPSRSAISAREVLISGSEPAFCSIYHGGWELLRVDDVVLGVGAPVAATPATDYFHLLKVRPDARPVVGHAEQRPPTAGPMAARRQPQRYAGGRRRQRIEWSKNINLVSWTPLICFPPFNGTLARFRINPLCSSLHSAGRIGLLGRGMVCRAVCGLPAAGPLPSLPTDPSESIEKTLVAKNGSLSGVFETPFYPRYLRRVAA